MILLVHSCDSRSWLWEHWWRFFDRSGWDIKVRFIVGEGDFSDQLIEEINSLDCEYLWYTLDDYFIIKSIYWEYYESIAERLCADVLRLAPNVQFNSLPYRFKEEHGIYRQLPESPYKISMCTSIWRREYFLSCLKPGLNPWQLENHEPANFGSVYFVPKLPFWYINGTEKGAFTPEAKELFKRPETYEHWIDANRPKDTY